MREAWGGLSRLDGRQRRARRDMWASSSSRRGLVCRRRAARSTFFAACACDPSEAGQLYFHRGERARYGETTLKVTKAKRRKGPTKTS